MVAKGRFAMRPGLTLREDYDAARLRGVARRTKSALWDFAKTNGFVLISQDADFAEMAALLGPPPKVIWLRGGNRPTTGIEQTLRRHAVAISAFDQDAGAACLEIY